MSILTLAWQFISIACKGFLSYFSTKETADKTNKEEADILVKQRDDQVITVKQADDYESTFNGH